MTLQPLPAVAAPQRQTMTKPQNSDPQALRALATDLEAAFLAEMLGYAGFGKSRESMGGGIGEDQFGSFLRQAQATEMARQGGIGLAESLFKAMSGGRNEP